MAIIRALFIFQLIMTLTAEISARPIIRCLWMVSIIRRCDSSL